MPSGTAIVDRRITVSAILCVALMAILWTGPYVVRDDLFSGDAAHHVFWFYQFANPALFPNDLSIEYFASDSVAPSGYRAFYAVLTSWFDAQRAAEWVAVAAGGIVGLARLAARPGAAAGCAAGHRPARGGRPGVPHASDRPDLADGLSAQFRAADDPAVPLGAGVRPIPVGRCFLACRGVHLSGDDRCPRAGVGTGLPRRSGPRPTHAAALAVERDPRRAGAGRNRSGHGHPGECRPHGDLRAGDVIARVWTWAVGSSCGGPAGGSTGSRTTAPGLAGRPRSWLPAWQPAPSYCWRASAG